MLRSKLMEMVKTISFKDLNRLDAYIKSPLNNKNEKICDLFFIIKEEYPIYGHNAALEKENIIKTLFGGQTKQEASLRVLMSQLTKLVEDFFIHDSLNKDFETYHTEILLHSLSKRGIDHILRKELDDALKKADEKKEQIIPLFHHRHELSKIALNQNLINHNRQQESGLQQVIDSLEVYYIATKLKYVCAALSRQDVLGERFHFALLDETIALANDDRYRKIPYINIYRHVYLLLTTATTESEYHYQQIKILLPQYHAYLSDDDRRDMHAWLANYCTKQIKSGQERYLYEIFELYKIMITEQMLLVNNHFLPNHYKNIVMTGLKLKEYDWTEQFIGQYASKLPDSVRETVFNYAKAALHFERGTHDDALLHLMNINPIDPYYGVNYRVLLCKTYYELHEFTALKANLESFRVFVLREKQLSEYNNLSYKNFINLLKRLVRCKEQGKKGSESLATDLKNTEPLISQQWLSEKIAEL